MAICFSDNGFCAISNLTNVIGACFSNVDLSFQSGVCAVEFLSCLCSTIFLTLERNKKLLITAGKIITAALLLLDQQLRLYHT